MTNSPSGLFDVRAYLLANGVTPAEIADDAARLGARELNLGLSEGERAFAGAAARALDGRSAGLEAGYVKALVYGAAITNGGTRAHQTN
jgi:hypothetical protein